MIDHDINKLQTMFDFLYYLVNLNSVLYRVKYVSYLRKIIPNRDNGCKEISIKWYGNYIHNLYIDRALR